MPPTRRRILWCSILSLYGCSPQPVAYSVCLGNPRLCLRRPEASTDLKVHGGSQHRGLWVLGTPTAQLAAAK